MVTLLLAAWLYGVGPSKITLTFGFSTTTD